MLSRQIVKDIRLSYISSFTNIYILFNTNLELVYEYNINLLYLAIMKDKNFPISKPIYFENKYELKAFNFFQCKVKVPNNLIHSIIQLYIKTKSRLKTISPTKIFEYILN